jgi:hypothetical protein
LERERCFLFLCFFPDGAIAALYETGEQIDYGMQKILDIKYSTGALGGVPSSPLLLALL